MLEEAIPSALGAAIYPPALLFVAFLLARPQPRKRALMFLSGAMAVTLGVGVAVVVLLRGVVVENPWHRSISPWIDLVLGLLLILFAVVVALRPPRGPKKTRRRRELGLLSLFTIGLVMYSPSPLYLASLHAIAKGHAGATATALSIVLVAAIYMLMAEVPVVAHVIWPEATLRTVTAINDWLSRHGRALICVAAAVFGTYLVISAVVHLV
jgi:threonine/homoserine/homoserine lactone efflux protein